MSWTDRAACKGLTDLFFPEHGESAAEARAVCTTCPVRAECRDAGLWENHGIWAGTNEKDRRELRKTATKPRPVEPINHGTPGGYNTHLRRNDPPCRICTEANSAAVLERRRRMAS